MNINTSLLPLSLAIGLLCSSASGQQQDALQSIESTRTGQHWVDEKVDPPKSPEESLKCFQIEPGMRIELVAAEPLIVDPVAIAFDRRGRMFVVEYRDYPTGPSEAGAPPLSRVVMLEDTDGDGRMDRRHLFADHLNYTNSLLPLMDGILVTAHTEIIFLKDTDGDHHADVRKVLFKGFKPHHEQMQISNPRWGMDNWIYFNYGPGTIHRTGRLDDATEPAGDETESKPYEMPRLDFRFHPLTMEFGPDSGLSQFGNTIDRWGRRFFSWNRNPIMMSMLPYRAVERNPFLVIPKAYADVGPSGGDAHVYPLVEMKSNWLAHAGTHTSACGVTACLGDLFTGDFANSVFACEPVGHLVTRSVIERRGVGLDAVRARPKADFLASTDTWCRPASLANGPDGALYLADMYRLYVEAPRFFPEETVKKLDWRAGEDRGRIWRIVPEGATPRHFTPPKTTDDLIALLADANGWRRFLAQRLFVERQVHDAVPKLRKLLVEDGSALTRLHALQTLDGLDALRSDKLLQALDDKSIPIRRHAIQLAAERIDDSPELLDKLLSLSEDPDIRIRYEVALTLGESDDPRVTPILTQFVVRDGEDEWFALAILTSAERRSAAILAGLVNDLSTRQAKSAHIDLVRELATIVGARGDEQELSLLLDEIGSSRKQGAWWQTAALSGLAAGLPRHQGELGRVTLPKLLADPPETLASRVAPVRELLSRTAGVATDDQLPVEDRVAAIELLGYQPFDEAVVAYEKLLAVGQPVEVQLACIQAMQSSGHERVAQLVFDNWPGLGPQVRQPALELLWRRISFTKQALETMETGRINPAVLDIDRRVRLLKHRDPEIKALAEKLFGEAVSENRREVAQQYSPALTQQGSAESGIKVFDRICAKCHRVDGRGHEVGPDISDVRNRSREALLYDILDPNREIDPKYTDYVVLTDDGQVMNGLMSGETADAVVLLQAENKQQVIARNQIEEIRASGKSLMPEGVEKDITVQQMADLLEYLKARNRSQVAATSTE